MSATLVVCPECGSPVAPGRLSCQSCGMLLATVVGAERPPLWAPSDGRLPDIDEDRPLASAQQSELEQGPDPAPEPTAPKRGGRRIPRPKAAAAAPAPAKARYVKSPPTDPDPDAGQLAAFAPEPGSAPPILHDWSTGARGPSAAPSPTRTALRARPSDGRQVAGAYLAPSATYVAPIPTEPPPARPPRTTPVAWPAQGTVTREPQWPSPGGNGTSVQPSPAGPTVAAEAASRTLSEWLIIGGATLATVSFVLPWATDGVIGSRGGSFTADWGLANPGHLLLIVATLSVLFLHLAHNRVPRWFRSSVLPLVIGGLLAGLAFAYYARPFGGGSGVAVLLAGALVLIGGGLLASRSERHGTSPSSV